MKRLRAAYHYLADSSPSTARGIFCMLAATVCFAAMGAIARHVSERIHPFEVVFFRLACGLLVLAPFVLRRGLAPFRTRRFGLHFARAAGHVAEMMLYFIGLTMIAFAQVQALTFATPLFASILAVLVLREQIVRWRVVGLAIGFAGAMVLIRPGMVAVETGTLLILISALGWSVVVLMIKSLARTDSTLTITAWMVVLMSPMALIPALFVWQWPGPADLAWLVACGIAGTLGQLAVTQAFRVADATAVLPFDFIKLLWASLLGFFVFGEVPTLWTWLGGALIFTGGFYIAWAERRANAAKAAR